MKKYFFVVIISLFFNPDTWCQPSVYLPVEDSLAKRPMPKWFGDAKLGIFIHWGLYSVPAYAPPELNPGDVKDWEEFYRNNPYAEWYMNTMQFEESKTQQYHRKTYGKDFSYYDFIPIFNESIKAWNADKMMSAIANSGARYVVLTTKHHDGFLLWPSQVPYPVSSPTKHKLSAERNIVGELCSAARKNNIRFGVYYSGGLDWSFYHVPINNLWPNLFFSMPKSATYADYTAAHINELVQLYKPDVVWNDIQFPEKADFLGLLANYYYQVPDGIINDRWNTVYKKLYGYKTPEYQVLTEKTNYKWETCRGIGNSFGYNKTETDLHHISADKLIDMLVDVVSKNGNLLLNIGPDASGNIPELQLQRLQALGNWVKQYGSGIFETTPYLQAEGKSSQKARIRYTQKGNTVFVFFLDKILGNTIELLDFSNVKIESIVALGNKPESISWSLKNNAPIVQWQNDWQNEYASVLKIILK